MLIAPHGRATGDIIGVIYNRAERTIAYTKNGMFLGVAFSEVNEERLFPTVRLLNQAHCPLNVCCTSSLPQLTACANRL